jgi:hypothetical protein
MQRTAELHKAAAQAKASSKEVGVKTEALAAAEARNSDLKEQLRTLTERVAQLQEDALGEHGQQRVLLPLGMEDVLDANEGDHREDARLGARRSGLRDVPSRGFSPWDYRKAFADASALVGDSQARRAVGSRVLDGPFAENAGDDRGSATGTRPSTAGGHLGNGDSQGTRRSTVASAGVNPAAKPFIASSSRAAMTAASSSNPSPTLSQRPLTSQASYQSSPSSLPIDNSDTSGHVPPRPLSQQQNQPQLQPPGPVGRQPQPPPPPPPQRGLQPPPGPFVRPHSQPIAPPQQQWAYTPHLPAARPAPYFISSSTPLASLGFFESGPDVGSANSGHVGGAGAGSGTVEKLPSELLPSSSEFVGGGGSGGGLQGGLLQPAGHGTRSTSSFGLVGNSSLNGVEDGSDRLDAGLPFLMMGRNGQASAQNIWG